MSTKVNYKTEIKQFGDLKVGDKIIGSDGQPTTITDVYEKHFPETMYEIEMEDGEVIQASGNHLWYCETDGDIKAKDEYKRLALDFFENHVIKEKLEQDQHNSLEIMTRLFGEDINTMMFIEKACRSLGYSSTTPHILLENKLKTIREETIQNYSYNDLIDFLHKMKPIILNNDGYFYFGEIRTTEEIVKLMSNGVEINIPHKSDVI